MRKGSTPTWIKFSAGLYDSMAIVAKKKKRSLPFTRDEFRAWLKPQFEDAWKGPICPYCSQTVGYRAATIDHVVPISAGGSLALSNLMVIDERCNQLKGTITSKDFAAFMDAMRKFADAHPEAAKDVLSRLSKSTKLAAGNRFRAMMAAKTRNPFQKVGHGHVFKQA